LPLKVLYAASTEDDSDLQALQPGAQNQSASGCDCRTVALSKVAPLRSVAVNLAFASIGEAFVESSAAIDVSPAEPVSAGSVSFVVVEPSGPQLETRNREKTKTKFCTNFFEEFIYVSE
jgi:hypothetical protein